MIILGEEAPSLPAQIYFGTRKIKISHVLFDCLHERMKLFVKMSLLFLSVCEEK